MPRAVLSISTGAKRTSHYAPRHHRRSISLASKSANCGMPCTLRPKSSRLFLTNSQSFRGSASMKASRTSQSRIGNRHSARPPRVRFGSLASMMQAAVEGLIYARRFLSMIPMISSTKPDSRIR
jgi:hypothetical protein